MGAETADISKMLTYPGEFISHLVMQCKTAPSLRQS